MKNSALPTTRATTAYGYLSAIAKLALEEPKRINMGVVVLRGLGLRGLGLKRFIFETSMFSSQVNPQALPACNTVGCVAGWGLTLAGKTNAEDTFNRASMSEATQLFGLTDAQADELFMPDHLLHDTNKQTKRHALAVVKHIKGFQKKYAAQLKAHKVVKAKS